MTTTLVISVTDELVAEIERRAIGYKSESSACITHAELVALLAERAELRRVIADVKWRVADTTDQLQATGFDGDRRYGLDEWSGPIKNLNMAIGILEKSLEPSK